MNPATRHSPVPAPPIQHTVTGVTGGGHAIVLRRIVVVARELTDATGEEDEQADRMNSTRLIGSGLAQED